MLYSFRYTAAILAAVILTLSACDQAPGPLDDAGIPPELSEFSFSPHEFIVPPGAGNTDALVPLSMEVTVRDADNDVEAVSFVVFGNTTLVEGVLASGSGGKYAGRSDVIVPAGEAQNDPPPAPSSKSRVLVLTDIENEPDDAQSLVRFLLCTNEMDVEGLLATTSVWMRDTTRADKIQGHIEAYREVRDNLLVHADGYPEADFLLSQVKTRQDALAAQRLILDLFLG